MNIVLAQSTIPTYFNITLKPEPFVENLGHGTIPTYFNITLKPQI